jgi:hypothetical protein
MEMRGLITVSLWAARLWPVLFVSVPLAIAHRHLRKPSAFFVFGCLSCYGVEWVAGQLPMLLQFHLLKEATVEDQFLRALLLTGAAVQVTAIVLAIGPLVWLWRVLKRTPQSPVQ